MARSSGDSAGNGRPQLDLDKASLFQFRFGAQVTQVGPCEEHVQNEKDKLCVCRCAWSGRSFACIVMMFIRFGMMREGRPDRGKKTELVAQQEGGPGPIASGGYGQEARGPREEVRLGEGRRGGRRQEAHEGARARARLRPMRGPGRGQKGGGRSDPLIGRCFVVAMSAERSRHMGVARGWDVKEFGSLGQRGMRRGSRRWRSSAGLVLGRLGMWGLGGPSRKMVWVLVLVPIGAWCGWCRPCARPLLHHPPLSSIPS